MSISILVTRAAIQTTRGSAPWHWRFGRGRIAAAIALASLGPLLSGCTPAVRPLTVTPTPALSNAGDAASFVRAEEAFLRALGTSDPRLASRLGLSPSQRDLEELGERLTKRQPGERQGGLVGSSLDPFALAARKSEAQLAYQRFLEAAGERSATNSATNANANANEAAERSLVRRLHEAEAARATLEQDLTVYGGDLLHAAALALSDTDGARAHDLEAARDAWLAERLGDVNDVFVTQKTSSAQRRELADALDPIERTLSGRTPAESGRFPRSFAALAKLRETTGEARMMSEGPLPQPAPTDLVNALSVLGEDRRPEELVKVLTGAEQALGTKAKEALAALSDREADRARVTAGKRLALRASCKHPVRDSAIRSLPASPEREAGCLAAHMLTDAKTPQELAEAWVLAHDLVAVALWSASFHGAHTSLDTARGKGLMLSLAEDATKSALLRKAALRPAAALGPGLVVALGVENGTAEPKRVARVVAFGDGDLAAMRGFVANLRPLSSDKGGFVD